MYSKDRRRREKEKNGKKMNREKRKRKQRTRPVKEQTMDGERIHICVYITPSFKTRSVLDFRPRSRVRRLGPFHFVLLLFYCKLLFPFRYPPPSLQRHAARPRAVFDLHYLTRPHIGERTATNRSCKKPFIHCVVCVTYTIPICGFGF